MDLKENEAACMAAKTIGEFIEARGWYGHPTDGAPFLIAIGITEDRRVAAVVGGATFIWTIDQARKLAASVIAAADQCDSDGRAPG